ncbi:6-phosphogluconolactonase [Aquimarina aquimarini]|uniref:6-phosphogluconolactonase n=1 Tax=Aquimarina aquimarini TaxID=1191734 RepID=UPI00131EDAD0|nr:6-phosphogluconolactonase [Aquimarina aquimarini]
MMNENSIDTQSVEEFVKIGCELIVEQAKESIEYNERFSLVLSGGRTPKLFFEELIKGYKEKINWSKVDIFWLDERCVPPNHDESNYNLAFKHLISKIDNIGGVYRIKGEMEPEVASKLYEEEIHKYFKKHQVNFFDFILLGMGEDGHVASLFPGSEEVEEKEKLVVCTKKEYNGHKRISLSLELINKSKKLLIINNKSKYNLFFENRDKNYPIHRITDFNLKTLILV